MHATDVGTAMRVLRGDPDADLFDFFSDTIVIGVGNLLRCDDGAGIHVVNLLKREAPHIDAEDVAMGSIEILEAMKGYDRVIVIDAVRTGAEPGAVFRVDLSRGEEPPNVASSHGVDLVIRGRDLLDATPRQLRLGRLLGGAHGIRDLGVDLQQPAPEHRCGVGARPIEQHVPQWCGPAPLMASHPVTRFR